MKTRFLIAIAGLLLAALSATTFAQSDFTGSWARDAKSDAIPNTTYWLTRGVEAGGGGGGRGGGRGGQPVMELKQAEGKLQITGPGGAQRTLVLDGKPQVVPLATRVQSATVTATLQGSTVTVSTSQPFGGMPGNATLKITETWSLSPDGKTLTVKTERDLPALKQTFNEMYTRR